MSLLMLPEEVALLPGLEQAGLVQHGRRRTVSTRQQLICHGQTVLLRGVNKVA